MTTYTVAFDGTWLAACVDGGDIVAALAFVSGNTHGNILTKETGLTLIEDNATITDKDLIVWKGDGPGAIVDNTGHLWTSAVKLNQASPVVAV